jgi:hypothetical protein
MAQGSVARLTHELSRAVAGPAHHDAAVIVLVLARAE